MAKAKLEKKLQEKNVEKKSNSSFLRKLGKTVVTGALWATLLLWNGCSDPKPSNWREWNSQNTEQVETWKGLTYYSDVLKKNVEVRENADWTFSVFDDQWNKISWDYLQIFWSTPGGARDWSFVALKYNCWWCVLDDNWEELSDYYDGIDIRDYIPSKVEKMSNDISARRLWQYTIIATKDKKQFIVKDWKVVSQEYDDIKPFNWLYRWIKWEKEYIEDIDNWFITWPVDHIKEVYVASYTYNDYPYLVLALNNWQQELYYKWKKVWMFPLSYSSDQIVYTLENVSIIDWKVAYPIMEDNWLCTIVFWDKKIKTEYNYVGNIEYRHGKIWYIWHKWDDVRVVSGNKKREYDESKCNRNNLDYYVEYWESKDYIVYPGEASDWI